MNLTFFKVVSAIPIIAILSGGCPNTGADAGKSCSTTSDCASGYSCKENVCQNEEANSSSDDAGIVTDAGQSPESLWTVSITKPTNESGHFAVQTISFKAEVTPPVGHDSTIEDIRVQWRDAENNDLYSGHDNESGDSSFSTALTPGHHVISAHVISLDTDSVLASASVAIYVCERGDWLDFSTQLDDTQWYTHISDNNNADSNRDVWHEDGYLLLSDGLREHTALIDISRQFTPGNLHLTFRMNMGQCAEPEVSCANSSEAADGFAISIFDMMSPQDMIDLIQNHTRSGGGLGYNLMNHITTDAPPPAVDAFHLQFDAYYNHTSIGHPHDDPTQNPHVQVHLNGSLENDLDPSPDSEVSLWTEIPELVDNQWHDMAVIITGTNLKVMRDDALLFEGTVPDYTFKGGFLVLSATTGNASMYQRIDDLEIFNTCPYQGPAGD